MKAFTHLSPRAGLRGDNQRQNACVAGSLRPRLCALASVGARSLSDLRDEFANREDEVAALNGRFNARPANVLVLLGPESCGKTRLLKEVKARRYVAQAAQNNGPPPILYLDCRRNNISSPQQFANVIRELITEDADLKEWWKTVPNSWAGSTVNIPGYQAELEKLFEPAPADELPIASIIKSLNTFLKVTRPLPYKPVFIIDEANVLMRWSDDPEYKQLNSLLSFFVWATKQEHLGHIVLASSNYFLVEWLKEGLARFYNLKVIGDLATVKEAKEFVQSRMCCGDAPSSFFDMTEDGNQIDMWPRVYKVCGGNIGLLELCASSAKDLGSWEEGICGNRAR